MKASEEINTAYKNQNKQLLDSMQKQASEIKSLSQPNTQLKSTVEIPKKLLTKDSAAKTSNSNTLQLHMLKKALHEKRCLIYQKQYLLNVLSGFQLIE